MLQFVLLINTNSSIFFDIRIIIIVIIIAFTILINVTSLLINGFQIVWHLLTMLKDLK